MNDKLKQALDKCIEKVNERNRYYLDLMLQEFKIGSKVKFENEKPSYEIRAKSERFLICTRKMYKSHDFALIQDRVDMSAFSSFDDAWNYFKSTNTVIYTVVDLKEYVRGSVDYIFLPYSLDKTEDCEDLLKDLEENKCSISNRTWKDLKFNFE